jgi:F-box/leucine-rich repeat protein 2/20
MLITSAVAPGVDGIPVEHSTPVQVEGPARMKGRQRILQSLQRISSSPSLATLGRKRASSTPYGSRNTLSSVSLTSSPSNGYPLSMAGPSTASTSLAGSPGPATPYVDGFPNRLAIRRGLPGSETPTPANIPMSELVPDSNSAQSGFQTPPCIPEIVEDYFSRPIQTFNSVRNKTFKFWENIPHEIKLAIFRFLKPEELVRISVVSQDFRKMCYDGQLWTSFDASSFYQRIPAESLAKIVVAAGPFIKNLNIRGCVQVEHYQRAEVVVKSCRNLVNATLEGCRNFKRPTLHTLLSNNARLAHINLTGLIAVNNHTCKVIAKSCPRLESFNVSWCTHMDARGVKTVLESCLNLRDLRAGEVRGFSSPEIAESIFYADNLERLVLSGCSDIDDKSLQTMFHGIDPEVDILENRPLVAPRKLRHVDLSRCNQITDNGIKALAWNVPDLEGLQLGGCIEITDAGLEDLLATTPFLTHLDLEGLSNLTNSILSQHLAKARCASHLERLSISYCESLGDTGMMPVIKECKNLKSIEMDNTRISDLVLAEAAAMVRARSKRTTNVESRPQISLSMVIFDCPNVTWTGIREVLSRNAEIKLPGTGSDVATYPTEVINLKCFYGYQPTVDEHQRRTLSGDLNGAGRLERRWADHMMMHEEASVTGAGFRRRRRRAREAAMLHADEEEGGVGMGGIGRRRRARSGGCAVM